MASTRDRKLHTYEVVVRYDERLESMHLPGTRVDFEPLNETFVLLKIWDENDDLYFWCLTDKSATCKIIKTVPIKKATRSGNVVTISDEQGGSGEAT